MNTVAPASSAIPARHAPPWSYASWNRSYATAVMSAPEAKASSTAVTPFDGGRHDPMAAPMTSALDAIAAYTSAWTTVGRYPALGRAPVLDAHDGDRRRRVRG